MNCGQCEIYGNLFDYTVSQISIVLNLLRDNNTDTSIRILAGTLRAIIELEELAIKEIHNE